MALTEYKKKRSFSNTPEPEGKLKTGKIGSKVGKKDKLLFVIQKHDASHLHYDLRLELKGVMKSWAVPKGPSLNPADKRLAMLVEDHPMEYNDFEGIIPPGNYGAGTVIIWDQGVYEPIEEAPKVKRSGSPGTKSKSPNRSLGTLPLAEQEKILLKGFFAGSLKIKLRGKKVKGEYALVKTSGHAENSWLLIKHRDEYVSEADITQKDKSVVSGQTIEQMAANKKSNQWISNRSSNGKWKEKQLVYNTTIRKSEVRIRKKKNDNSEAGKTGSPEKRFDKIADDLLALLKKKKRSAMPGDLRPMLATLVDEPFNDPAWIYEVKWDGYRTLAYLNKGKVELRSRNNNSFIEKFYPVYEALQEWNIDAIIDGEIVVVNEKGLSQFSSLQNWRSEADGDLLVYVFDILWLKGIDCTQLPLTERRNILRQLVTDDGIIRFSENFDASGTELFEVAQKLGLEGIIAKKADSTYQPDTRTKNWLKIKTEQRHEAVIAGYTRNEGSSKKFSALILGVYESGHLQFIGQAGTGFTDKMQTEILKKLKPLETATCPFKEEPVINKPTRFRRNPPKADVTWVKPKLVSEVRYQELTPDGIMRHPSFQGLRDDKDAKEVVRETTSHLPRPLEAKKNKSRVYFEDLEKKENIISRRGLERKRNKSQQDLQILKDQKTITPAKERERKTFLNPREETQTQIVNGHELKFTNLSKLYWPKEKITKREMINYYYSMLPYMLPYMKDRPQSLNRHPDGIGGESFYQKNVAGKVDNWITTHHYKNTTHEGEKTFFVCTDEASLLYIAKLGCIEMNPWHSRIQSPDNPDWCVIDLDPDNNSFEQVIETANLVKKILDAVDIPSYPKTSGSTGIHIYIPLGAKYNYDQSKQLAELIVTFAHEELSDFTSIVRNPAKRKGKIYLDFLQNRAIQTIASPYSLRPKPGATVSAPLLWEEVKKGLSIQDFTMFNMPERVKSEGDLFKGVLGKGIDMQKVLKKITTVFS
ncbi:MAG: DNA ligase D [Chitinophagaceae bacterium]|nr:DNA ligase D [Chitinophagaceae bacterium]